jgi:hypothetical protein
LASANASSRSPILRECLKRPRPDARAKTLRCRSDDGVSF